MKTVLVPALAMLLLTAVMLMAGAQAVTAVVLMAGAQAGARSAGGEPRRTATSGLRSGAIPSATTASHDHRRHNESDRG